MQDSPNGFDTPMQGLKTPQWLEKLEEVAEDHGYFQRLGPNYFATFVEDKPTLLVTFETIEGIQERGDTGQPLGFELVKELGWSHLCILTEKQSWFRDPAVYAFFDRASDDGFFDEFDNVLFYGAGPCGYAAATYSVASPGARVVVLNPQATLTPSLAGWDKRFEGTRMMSFTDRYGFAPDMIEAAEKAYVIYNDAAVENTIHAALFRRPNVELLPVPVLGNRALEMALQDIQVLFRILVQAGVGKMTRQGFYSLMRARRDHGPYLRSLLRKLNEQNRPLLTALLCANVTSRMHAPNFARTLSALEKAAVGGDLTEE
ncbi:phosphoadenosine phosphosulfate reductase [Shimia sediminis]|uniref:phosphoadenosine phosphosulfate reductase n=1 Tax=Shimia sediminis TaxID=2497945 RepID=UPI000F8D4743|nr:phosphoadenosine phosphosulfate reductase [Shimia sediminis]